LLVGASIAALLYVTVVVGASILLKSIMNNYF